MKDKNMQLALGNESYYKFMSCFELQKGMKGEVGIYNKTRYGTTKLDERSCGTP